MNTTTQADVYLSRQKKVVEKIGQNSLQGLLVVPGASMYYFTGLTFHLSERPVLLIFSAEGSLTLVAPDFEKIKIEGLSYPLSAVLYGENPDTWVSVFSHAVQQTGISRGRVAVEPTGLRYLELDLLQKAGFEADLSLRRGATGWFAHAEGRTRAQLYAACRGDCSKCITSHPSADKNRYA